MFSRLAEKFHAFSDHHQTFIAVIVTVGIIIASWSIEKILETYLPPKTASYVATFGISLIILWIIKHFILHVW